MQIEHKKNTAYYLSFPMVDSSSPASFKTGVSPADTGYYKDGAGAWTSLAITDTASEIGSTGVYEIDLSAAEMNHDQVMIKFSVAGAADTAFLFDMRTKIVSDLNDVSTADVNAQCDTAISDASLATAAALSTVDGIVDTILVDTGTTLPATLTTMEGKIDTVDGVVDNILLDTNELQGDWVDGGRLDQIIDAILADTGTDGVVLSTATQQAIADTLLDRDMSTGADSGSTTVRTVRQALRFLRNKWSISGTTLTVTKEDDSTASWTSTVTTNASADPVTANDPAGP